MNPSVLRGSRKLFFFVLFMGVLTGCGIFLTKPTHAVAGVNQQMNFQGRLLNAQGAIVPDGFYNIQFKIYQDGDGNSAGDTTGTPAGSLKWTESYLNASSQGVEIRNGYMSVQLGSIMPFGNSVDWNQDTLWLSMNIAGTNTTCTPFASCSPDGEMLPMKRLSSTPYAMNAGHLGGLVSTQFLQLAQGVQTDASSNTASIYINKTGSGNLLALQSSGIDTFTLSNAGNISLGSNDNHTLSVATSGADTSGKSLTLSGGAGGSGTGALNGGDLVLQGGAAGGVNGNGGNVAIDAGVSTGGQDGTISIGSVHASTIQIGSTALASGTQTISIGANNTAGGTTDVTIGAGGSAAGGSTTLQAKTSISLKTNGISRATFDNANNLYLGNGITASAPNNFTIQGTGSTASGVTGGNVTIQGGNATVGNTNGGNLLLTGGSGVGTGSGGLVVISTPTFAATTNDPNCFTNGALVAASCTIAASSVDNSATIVVGFSKSAKTAILPAPTNNTVGRVVYITAANTSQDFTLSVNGGGTGNEVAMRQNTSATMVWNGNAWAAAGASSSTTLQAAYDNTLQSAGGAELVVSHTSNTNGLTIRDSTTNPVSDTLLSVQSSSAAGLLSVNSNVTEYTSNSGAEIPGSGGAASFPANTWSAIGGATVTRYTTAGNHIATGQGSVSTATSSAANDGVKNTLTSALTAGSNYNVSFAARLDSGIFTDMNVYYSTDGTTASVPCKLSQAVPTSVWTKVNCTFAAPSSGTTASNAILIRQSGSGTARTFYVDNLSVTIAADYNYASDGNVMDGTNFATNWTAAGGATVTRDSTVGNDASNSAKAVTSASGQGVRNKLSINLLPNTLYRATVYVASSTPGFNTFTVRYSRDGGTNFVDCADYNTRDISSSLTGFTKVTCYITTDGTAATNSYVYFTQSDTAARSFYVDTFALNLSTATTPNVQIGGGVNGGPVTLLTLDRGASAPIASNNDALLGSMYYDTSLGKLQCYEADGWGACGSSPDNIVTISPEFTNAVMHGTGVGTMVSDICSDTLDINDGSSGQPTICGTNETYNFYKWTSPQATPQTYGIYVTYQLPDTFSGFASSQTSIMGRTDSANSAVQYQIYRNDSTNGLTPCGSSVSVSSGIATSWKTGLARGAADPSTCGFAPSNSIVFKITVTASQNASAYVGNLNFTFSNK